MTLASPLPLGVPAFKPIPQSQNTVAYQKLQKVVTNEKPTTMQRLQQTLYSSQQNTAVESLPGHPVFKAMPNSISRISHGSTEQIDKNEIQSMISPYAHVSIVEFFHIPLIKFPSNG